MEVLSVMSMPVQSSNVQSGTGYGDESESLRTTPAKSAQFSRVFDQQVRGGDKKENSTDLSSTDHLSRREVASMKQFRQSRKQLQPEQQQMMDQDSSVLSKKASYMESSQGEINDKSEPTLLSDASLESDNLTKSDVGRKPLSETALFNLPWNQLVIPDNASFCKDTDRPLFMGSGNSVITTEDLAVPVFGASANAGFLTETQGNKLIEQQPVIPQREETGVSTTPGNPLDNLTAAFEENRGVNQESASLKGPSFLSEAQLNRHSPGELVPSDVGVIASNGNVFQQGINPVQANPEPASPGAGGSPLQPEELQKSDIMSLAGPDTDKTLQGAAISTVNIKPMVGDNEPNANRIFARGAFGKTGGLISPATIDARPSGEAKIKSQNSGTQLQENNGLATKPDPNGIETHQAPQSFDVDAKTMIKEAGSDTKSNVIEEKPANNNSALFVHVQSEAKTREESGLASSTNNGKLPSAEQIYHQVRERLESGDYGINKSSITLKLHPEEMGELRINLRMEELRLKVDIVTDNRSVKEALMQNLDTLKETLSKQNISMDQFNVSADIRQGFQRGSGNENRMMQNNRVANAPAQTKTTVEDSAQPILNYGWENDSSLVSLVL